MAELYIIDLNSSNGAAFDAIAKQQATKDDCDKLSDPRVQAEIAAFITAQRAAELPASSVHSVAGEQRVIFSHDASVNTDLNALALSRNGERTEYISKLHKLIVADTVDTGKKIKITMDPLPAGKRVGIFFKSLPSDVWSIASAVSTPKLDYIAALLNHDDVPGLKAQLAIYEYHNGTAKTRILARRYMMEYKDPANPSMRLKPDVLEITAMYVQHDDNRVEQQYTPEDAFINTGRFMPIAEWEKAQKIKYGRQISHRYVTSATQCTDFMNGDVHFTIYKTSHADAASTIIGQYLQMDSENKPFIQSRNASVVETTIDELLNQYPALALRSQINHAPSAQAWKNSGFKHVQQVNADTVKVTLNATSHIVETRSSLSLYGQAKEDHMRAMICHAKEHWRGRFKIESGTEAEKRLMRKLAAEAGVTIIEAAPARPVPAARRASAPQARAA